MVRLKEHRIPLLQKHLNRSPKLPSPVRVVIVSAVLRAGLPVPLVGCLPYYIDRSKKAEKSFVAGLPGGGGKACFAAAGRQTAEVRAFFLHCQGGERKAADRTRRPPSPTGGRCKCPVFGQPVSHHFANRPFAK